MRQLARVVKIEAIESIQGADLIEVAKIGGWRIVVKKGEYQVGDLAVYFEIDSFLRDGNSSWQFLVDKSSREFEGVKGHVLRSVKLKGVVSQGLLLPNKEGHPLGTDLTEQLGIVKYEPPIPTQLAGIIKGVFPSRIPKTDQERIQNLSGEWGNLSSKIYEVTEKLEGSSMTVYLIEGEFGVCSRNLDLSFDQNNTLWRTAISAGLEGKMRSAGDNIALQGELIGEGIQGNYYEIRGHKFFVFDIYDINNGGYLTPEERREYCRGLGIDHVPVISQSFSVPSTEESIDELMDSANANSMVNPKKRAEGLVFKSTKDFDRYSFKVISNQYLLKQK